MSGAPNPDEVLPLKVEPHMRQPLFDSFEKMCRSVYGPDVEMWRLIAQMLKVDYSGKPPEQALVEAVNRDNDLLLDMIDARLKLNPVGTGYGKEVEELTTALKLGGSGWCVNNSYDGLEQVIDDTTRTIIIKTITDARSSASCHLAKAWELVYGRNKNPTAAHNEMIRAVESASIPALTPRDVKATLGTIIGHLKSQGHLYSTIGASETNNGVVGVTSMMEMLWQQQTDRHGSESTISATQERVEQLLPIAAALTHIFSISAIYRI
jgi:hypothetical protein